jgi:hypothetical protein
VNYVSPIEGWDQEAIGHNWDNVRGLDPDGMWHVDPATGRLPSTSQEEELAAAKIRHPSGKIPPLKPVTQHATVPRR